MKKVGEHWRSHQVGHMSATLIGRVHLHKPCTMRKPIHKMYMPETARAPTRRTCSHLAFRPSRRLCRSSSVIGRTRSACQGTCSPSQAEHHHRNIQQRYVHTLLHDAFPCQGMLRCSFFAFRTWPPPAPVAPGEPCPACDTVAMLGKTTSWKWMRCCITRS